MKLLGLAIPETLTREADRLYGELLILLGLVALAAPLFVEATLAWSLLFAGVAGVWWVLFDRGPRGLVAAVGWSLIALALGLHLSFHILLGVIPLDLALALGFAMLGTSELLLGVERYRRRHVARVLMVVGGAAAIGFALVICLLWPAIPSWAGAVTVATMFIGFGAAVLVGDHRAWARPPAAQPAGSL